ncbi:hypothetical protein NZ698_12745 [Chryseobacterium sp. PBS4-4]|uniref:DUF3887 domain-containing protein n=1 Tax=Chryseobacterium edaphi TaxID=2976532 RepID=A0ABT2W785_9FLAO|nr:hypothetical protein [Chryseobacterium edaphi]MCU7618071.1 hypothetical protein [Chryseobacterium edaphi]
MKKILLFVTLTLFVSCSFNQTFSNRESDRDEAAEISKKFYWELSFGGNQDDLYNLFGEQFFEVTSKDKLNQMNLVSQNEIGQVQDYTLVKWETLVVKGSNPRSEYVLTYDVKREKGKTQETFSMNKKEGEIKIVGYHINQGLLDK